MTTYDSNAQNSTLFKIHMHFNSYTQKSREWTRPMFLGTKWWLSHQPTSRAASKFEGHGPLLSDPVLDGRSRLTNLFLDVGVINMLVNRPFLSNPERNIIRLRQGNFSEPLSRKSTIRCHNMTHLFAVTIVGEKPCARKKTFRNCHSLPYPCLDPHQSGPHTVVCTSQTGTSARSSRRWWGPLDSPSPQKFTTPNVAWRPSTLPSDAEEKNRRLVDRSPIGDAPVAWQL